MKILFLSPVYIPETGACAVRIYEFAKYLVEKGNIVTVISGFPTYPTGVIPKEFRWKLSKREKVEGVDLLRVRGVMNPQSSILVRLFNECCLMMMFILYGIKLPKYDVIVVTSPPLILALSAYVISRIKRIKFIFDVRDIYPEVVIALGGLKNSLIIRVLKAVEVFLYKSSSKIITVSDGCKEILKRNKDVYDKKVYVIPNGVNLNFFKEDTSRKNEIRKEFDLDDKFVVGYTGRLGRVHGVDNLIKAAKILEYKKDILFLIIGNGSIGKNLIKLTQNIGVENVKFFPEQSFKKIPHVLSCIDVGVATAKKLEILKIAIHVKMLEYMASKLPVVLSADGESKRILEEANAGICVPPDNPTAVADAILTLYENPQLRKEYGAQGRRYIEKYFSREELAKRLENVLIGISVKKHMPLVKD